MNSCCCALLARFNTKGIYCLPSWHLAARSELNSPSMLCSCGVGISTTLRVAPVYVETIPQFESVTIIELAGQV